MLVDDVDDLRHLLLLGLDVVHDLLVDTGHLPDFSVEEPISLLGFLLHHLLFVLELFVPVFEDLYSLGEFVFVLLEKLVLLGE